MNVNTNQEIVIDALILILQSWKNTNDISSPSHYGYIDETLNTLVLQDSLPDSEQSYIETSLKEILDSVRNTTFPL